MLRAPLKFSFYFTYGARPETAQIRSNLARAAQS